MRNSRERILTSHAGSLPRPDSLIEANHARDMGQSKDEAGFQRQLRTAVTEVVAEQKQHGVDIPNDGEFGKAMGHKINYRAWWSYSFNRLGGLDISGARPSQAPVSRNAGDIILSDITKRRDRSKFAAVYADPESGVNMGPDAATYIRPVCVGPVTYKGHDAIKADIDNFKAALEANGFSECFMTSIGPGSASRIGNEHYQSDEEFVFALADVMAVEYRAIVDAGLMLQVDDAVLMHECDSIMSLGGSFEDYRRWAELRVEALNHALKGLPEDRVRYHVCWGSWHGPHAYDTELRDVVDLILRVNAGAYQIEQANPRHEHEWRVWEDVALPEGKKLIPGVVTHHTNVVEHPELVAQRLTRLAEIVGRDNVIGGTDCGFAQGAFLQRVHVEIQWAKLTALAEGARLATQQLWSGAVAS
jgi:5-methyltetrahydropteroyltriglutamate--homocysteine methyltransferase